MLNVSYLQNMVLRILLFFTRKISHFSQKNHNLNRSGNRALLNTKYLKKARDGTIDIVVNDLIKSKGSNGRAANKQYRESVEVLHECGINILVDTLYKRVE